MGSHVAAPVLTPNVKYDSARDFDPIGLTAHSPAVIVARKDFPAKNLSEFVAYLKQNGDKLKQAHGGIGASSHMACLLFNQALDIRPTSVAYRGTAPAMNDLVGGHVDFLCEQSVSVAEQVAAGTVKAYVVSANQRLAALPNIPSAKEGGINYQMSIWAGIFAPKGTSKEIIAKLATALDKALDDSSVKKRLAELDGEPWTARARRAAVTLTAGADDEPSLGQLLLADIRAVFEPVPRDPDAPWPEPLEVIATSTLIRSPISAIPDR